MKATRLLSYLIALVLIAWVLGSLARSGTAGGSILANSIWLVYAVELLPLVALGLMVLMIGWLVWNWKFFSEALGHGMTRRRAEKKKWTRLQAVIFIAAWAIAGAILLVRCHGLVCGSENTASAVEQLGNLVSGSGPVQPLPFLGPVLAFASLIDTNLFTFAFLGVLIVGSAIAVRAVVFHLQQVHNQFVQIVEVAQERGRQAAEAAIRVLDNSKELDARSRILLCYNKMIVAASELGAPVGPEKTARELEKGVRSMFLLKGPGIARLTSLFEEARYSLHPMSWEDAETARGCLVEISEELSRTVSIEA